MEQHHIPDNIHSNEVITGDLDIEEQYRQHISDLNTYSPTPDQAQTKLGRMSIDPSSWDRWIAEGVLEDTNHEIRVLIAIASGDPRPMGEIYDEMRRQAKGLVDPIDVDKARAAARRYDPFSEKSPYF